MKKFTREDTKNAMRIAMKLKSKYAKKLKCNFNEISLSICLKEAYKTILKMKQKVVNVIKKVSTIFSQNEISVVKDGWKKFYEMCEEFGYNIKATGCQHFTHRISCSKSDYDTLKEMLMES